MSFDNLLESIADTVKDYRQGEIDTITPSHINRWVRQFDEDARIIILKEMDNILKKYYVSKQESIEFLEHILHNSEIFGDDVLDGIEATKFLNIQRKGESQNDLIKLIRHTLEEYYDISLDECGKTNPSRYIYLDDCLFSGNTVRYDLKNWVADIKEPIELHLVFIALHTDGYNYVVKSIRRDPPKKMLKLITWRKYEFNNDPNQTEMFECFWPMKYSDGDFVDEYVEELIEGSKEKMISPRLFRPVGLPLKDNVFSSPRNRIIIEHSFLKAGVQIRSFSKEPKEQMRPLGYHYLTSLGFGGLFITYRNISNNCPLALWWGDPDSPKSHPLSRWYPLFLRKGNS